MSPNSQHWTLELRLLCVACIYICNRIDGLDFETVSKLLKQIDFFRTSKTLENLFTRKKVDQLRKKHPKLFVQQLFLALHLASQLDLITLSPELVSSFISQVPQVVNKSSVTKGDDKPQSSKKSRISRPPLGNYATRSTSRAQAEASNTADHQAKDTLDKSEKATHMGGKTSPINMGSQTLGKRRHSESPTQDSSKPTKQLMVAHQQIDGWQDIQTNFESMKDNMSRMTREMTVPGHARIREWVRKLEIMEKELKAAKTRANITAEEEIEWLKKEVELIKAGYETERKVLLEQHEADKQLLREELSFKKECHESRVKKVEEENLRLRRDNEEVCRSGLLPRTQQWPIEYNAEDTGAHWNKVMKAPIEMLSPRAYETPDMALCDGQSLSNFRLVFATATATSPSLSEHVDVASRFSMLSLSPTNHSLVVACFVARVLRWVFDTPFQVDETQRESRDDLYSVIATTWGLQVVRTLDMLATIKMTQNTYFKDIQITLLAEQQSTEFENEFARFLSLNQPLEGFNLEHWLLKVMRLKLELILSLRHHRIEFVRPGTMFDPTWMSAITDEGGKAAIAPDTQYRVRLCVAPALVSGIDDTKWSQGSGEASEVPDYKLALLESRNFFAEEPKQRESLHHVSAAVVLVEATSEDGGMDASLE